MKKLRDFLRRKGKLKKVYKKPKEINWSRCSSCKIKVPNNVSDCVICGKELFPNSVDHFTSEETLEEERNKEEE
jgi:hypothetical protein